ncbi:hypothetical protein [Enterococcus sp. BWR-S5]|uniref:hypothetical protein n=1 Tax=Enterococcus sp. BWR-S5 TaxID=2787714 RepID=UPI001924419F|nr:hypothetical protein [Enterococcus sp. BWR-S5]MBL1223774.1 hypothetical protein [Enterococcus sp. BWR-S5]
MKNLKKIVGTAALSMLLLTPVTAQAWGNEGEYVHFFDSDIRLPLVGKTATFTQEKYDELIKQFNEKYQVDYDALYAEYDNKQEEFDRLDEELSDRYSNEEITEEEYTTESEKLQADREAYNTDFDQRVEAFEAAFETGLEKLEKQQEDDVHTIETYELTTKEVLASVDTISTELLSLNPSLSGLEFVPNLKNFTGEMGKEWTVSDTRPLLKTTKMEVMDLPISNQMNLNSMKNLTNLKILNVVAGGYANDEDREQIEESANTERFTETLLTDISALSNATNLESLYIQAEGALPVVTLKKGTTSYELVDPLVLSSQFDGAAIAYTSELEDNYDYRFESNDQLKWEGLTGEEDVLLFNWNVSKGRFGYNGTGQIPIRWK